MPGTRTYGPIHHDELRVDPDTMEIRHDPVVDLIDLPFGFISSSRIPRDDPDNLETIRRRLVTLLRIDMSVIIAMQCIPILDPYYTSRNCSMSRISQFKYLLMLVEK
ncbi:hypothetical protein E2P81_ATG11370 [Venturia nashicola]|nr:hypothetical protein E2P81_ATG11370 [Venturia nashicola]